MLNRQLYSSQAVELIEDSEPEREEYRKRRKEERRRKRRHAKTVQVIELTDSDSSDSVTLDTPLSPLITNFDDGPQGSHEMSVYGEVLGPVCSVTSGRTPATARTHSIDSVEASTIAAPYIQTQTETANGSDASDAEVEERTHKLRTKIGSFAFSKSSQVPSVAESSSKTSQQIVHVVEPSKGRLSRQSSAKAVALYLDFSECQLKYLLKCVGCDLKWTIRKSAVNKVSHMRSCAKKARITEETMKVLISREIRAEEEKTEAMNICHKEPPPKTYLEHVVKEDIAVRPAKRQKELVNTVKAVSESRDDIRNRARTILNRRCPGQSIEHEREPPEPRPPTQTLGQRRPGSQTTLAYLDDEDGPPLTQSLPGSKLARTRPDGTHAHALNLIAEPPSPDSPELELPDDSKLSSARCLGLTFGHSDPAADVVSPCHTALLTSSDTSPKYKGLTVDETGCYSYSSDDNNGTNDNAILFFDPETRGGGDIDAADELHTNNDPFSIRFCPTRTPTVGSRTKANSNHLAGDVTTAMAKLDLGGSVDVTPVDNTPSSQKRRAKRVSPNKRNTRQNKGQSKDPSDDMVNDEELFLEFKSMILEDETLYLRVLRYEPIRLDVFMDMAQERIKEHDLGSLVLRVKLKTFLDKQAIHYCEPGAWGRR